LPANRKVASGRAGITTRQGAQTDQPSAGQAEHEQSADEEIEALRAALFDESLRGIRDTGHVYPLGAFLLVGAMIDTLVGLGYAPESNADGKQGQRYADFVQEFFASQCAALKLGPRLWRGLRCRPLHNFSADDLVLADSQSADIHLQHETNGRVLLHWPQFLEDYTGALERYWVALETDPLIRRNALVRCLEFPPVMVTDVVILPSPLSISTLEVPVTGASAWAGR
jgi:hypothetical protein